MEKAQQGNNGMKSGHTKEMRGTGGQMGIWPKVLELEGRIAKTLH